MLSNNGFTEPFRLYFVGIGGTSMAALSLIMKSKGFYVSGYDATESELTEKLRDGGIRVNVESDLENCDLAVVSSAISDDNRVIRRLNDLKKAIVPRAWLLSELCKSYPLTVGVAGTHGKTTCTCLIAHVLKSAEKGFTLHVGGEDADFGNAYISGSDIFLTEICEFKRNIAYFSPSVGVVLNVDNDHEESYGSFENLASEFRAYAERSKIAVVNLDDENLSRESAVTFSFSDPSADFFVKDVSFDGKTLECAVFGRIGRLFDLKSRALRYHDVYNVVAATAVCSLLGIGVEEIKRGIESFRGVKRRNEFLGEYDKVPVYADYAHHPAQVAHAVEDYKKRFGENTRFLFQSHTYSRTARLSDDFVRALAPAGSVRLFETYGAREKFDENGSYKKLGYKLKNAVLCDESEGVGRAFEDEKECVSAYVVLGAGDLYDRVKKFLAERNGASLGE